MEEANPYSAPQAAVQAPLAPAPKLTTKQMLFSAEGRIRRKDYWLWSIAVGVIFTAVFAVVVTVGIFAARDPYEASGFAGGNLVSMVLTVVLYVLMLWTTTAIQIKRWHDRDKSGWWVLINFVPVLGLWALVEAGFLEGTRGDNRYGPDPKAGEH